MRAMFNDCMTAGGRVNVARETENYVNRTGINLNELKSQDGEGGGGLQLHLKHMRN